MDKFDRILLAWGLLSILGVVVVGHYFAVGKVQMTYEEYQARAYLTLCKGTTDLATMQEYLQKTLNSLENKQGNPDWLYSLPGTDYANIKHTITKSIEMIDEVLETEEPNSYAYQRTVENILRSVDDTEGSLKSVISWKTDMLPFNLGLLALYCIYSIVTVIVVFWGEW